SLVFLLRIAPAESRCSQSTKTIVRRLAILPDLAAGLPAWRLLFDKQEAVGRDRLEAYLPPTPKYSQRCSAIGTLPFFQTKSWKARRLNFSPCCMRDSARNLMIWSLPFVLVIVCLVRVECAYYFF